MNKPPVAKYSQEYVEELVKQFEARLEQVYAERNCCAIALAKIASKCGLNAGRGMDDNENHDPEWRHVVYIEMPGGEQVSYHINPQQVHLLEGLPEYTKSWDGTYRGRDHDWSELAG